MCTSHIRTVSWGRFSFRVTSVRGFLVLAGNVRHAVMMSVALGCAENVSPELASTLISNPKESVEIFSKDPLALTGVRPGPSDFAWQRGVAAMTPPTLHRLLWGPDSEHQTSLADGHIRAWEVPAVGLPARVAAYLFAVAQNASLPSGWDGTQGPLTWQLEDKHNLLSGGRRLQFDFEDAESRSPRCSLQPQVKRSTTWEVPPHAAYYLPFVAGPSNVRAGSYALYCDILLLLTAMDGGEAILDRLAENGVGSVPFEDRWAWRSRLHLPKQAWQAIERGLRWSEQPQQDATRKSKGAALVDISAEKDALQSYARRLHL